MVHDDVQDLGTVNAELRSGVLVINDSLQCITSENIISKSDFVWCCIPWQFRISEYRAQPPASGSQGREFATRLKDLGGDRCAFQNSLNVGHHEIEHPEVMVWDK